MFKNVKMSLADICGEGYAKALATASAAVGNMKYEQAAALACEKVDFFSEQDMARSDALLDSVGTQLVAPFENNIDGAPTDSFRHAENKSAAPYRTHSASSVLSSCVRLPNSTIWSSASKLENR